MKNLFFVLLTCLPFFSFAQSISTIDAPIGFLRAEPDIMATIVVHIPEKEQVKVLEKINQVWSKVEYVQNRKKIVGYLTNQTLGEVKVTKRNNLAMKPRQ